MPVPSSIDDLSQTAGSNSPPGSESPTTADDYLRTYASFIALLRDGKGHSDEVQVASAATADIGAANSLFVEITGTTTITSFGTTYNGPRFVRFSGALTLTHNASTLILPGGASITTAAGDCALVIPNSGSPTGWRVTAYQKAAGGLIGTVPIAQGGTGQTTASAAFTALKQAATDAATGVVELATDVEAKAGTSTSVVLTPANLKAAQIQASTAITLTNQTEVGFTGISSWAQRVTFLLSGVSTNGTSQFVFQIGDSGGYETSGYLGGSSSMDTAVATTNYTTGFGVRSSLAANTLHGSLVIEKVTGNTWSANGSLSGSNAAFMILIAGSKQLSDVLDRVRIITGNGTDQFDGGAVNIIVE